MEHDDDQNGRHSMSKHTKGPWEWADDGSRLIDGNGNTILCPTCYGGETGIMIENEADAILIEAAPDLLEALTTLRDGFCNHLEIDPKTGKGQEEHEVYHDVIAANAAIAKAGPKP